MSYNIYPVWKKKIKFQIMKTLFSSVAITDCIDLYSLYFFIQQALINY